MEELLPVVSDDLDWKESGHKTRTPADHTRYLGWEGKWYRLDMTTAHTMELEKFLDVYVEAGNHVDAPAKARTPRKRTMQEAISENEKKAEWAREHGHKVTTRLAGGYYFPVKTEKAWQEAQRVLGSGRSE